jgi:predicted porin
VNTKVCCLVAAFAVPIAAQAQSSVTLYGILDSGLEFLTNSNKTSSSQISLQAGNYYGNRWGILGREDLGGGLVAFFNLESGFSINDGTASQSGRLFGRRAYIGLKDDGAEIRLGRLRSLLYEDGVHFDPNALSTYAADSHDLGFVTRPDNAVMLRKKVGNFTADFLYSFGYDSVAVPYGATSATASQGKLISGALTYSTVPFAITAIYEKIHGPLTSGAFGIGILSPVLTPKQSSSADRVERYMVATRWTLGNNSAYIGYRFLKATLDGVDRDVNMGYLGDRYNFSPSWSASATVYHSRVSGMDIRPTTAVVDVEHFLSKRTSIYLNTSYVFNTKLSTLGVHAGGQTLPGKNQFGTQLGVVHRF